VVPDRSGPPVDLRGLEDVAAALGERRELVHEVRLGHEVPRSPGNGRLSARRRARNLPKRAGADQRRTPRREAGPGRRARGAWGEPGRGRGVVRGGRRLAAMKIPRAPRFEVASITFTDRARDMVRSFLSDDGAASEA